MFRYLLLLSVFISLGISQNVADYPTTLPTHDTFTVLANSARDDLATTITDVSTSIVLSDASEFFSPGANEAGIIKIDDEFIKYCTITINTLTVCASGRAFDGSSAAAHNAGATVLGIYAAHHHNQLAAELVAVADSLGPVNTVANLPGTPTDGDLARVTDGNSTTDCTIGSGTDIVLCMYDTGAGTWGNIGSGGGITNYVEAVADGTGIDGTATGTASTYTPVLDLTEINDHTYGDNSDPTITQIFNPTGSTNITWEYTDGEQLLTIGSLKHAKGVEIEATDLTFWARKGSPGTLNPGDVAHVSGFNAGTGFIEVELADADDASTMPAVGIVETTITNTAEGIIVEAGELFDLDTSSFSVTDELYVSTTAGVLTSTIPTGESSEIQKIAIVLRSHVNMGILEVLGAGRSNALPNLDSANFWVGSSSNVAATVAMSGDATLSNTGLFTIVTADAGIVIDSDGTFGVGEGVAFGDGDTEIFESADDILQFSIAGEEFLQLGGSQTALFQDTTVTTGDTLVIIKGGAGELANIFEVQLSDGSTRFNIDSNGVLIGTNVIIALAANIGNFNVRSNSSWPAIYIDGSQTFTSGEDGKIQISGSYAPTSGTGIYYSLLIEDTINQTGGANGITRGLYVNPTLTAAVDFRGIEVADVTNSHFAIKTGTGKVDFGDTVTVVGGGINVDTSGTFGTGTGLSFGDSDMEIYESADDLLKFDPGVDSVTAFQFLDADGGTPILNIDSTNERVGIRTATPGAALDVFSGGIKVDSGGVFGGGTGIIFGDGDTEIYEFSDDLIVFGISGQIFLVVGGNQTALYQDTTATTGDTLFIVKEGAATSNNLVELQENNGDLGWTFSSPVNMAAGRATGHTISAWGGSTTGEDISFNSVNVFTQTSGVADHIIFEASFNPTSGTAIFNSLNIETSVNQTGGASGISRGIYINPSIAAAADFRGIEIVEGGLFVVEGGIDVTFGTIKFGDVDPIASATTTALTVNNMFHITGTTTITTLNTCDSNNDGRPVTLIFDGVLTFTDGNNLKLAGDFVTTADDTIDLVCDGTNWYEISRSIN